MSVRGRVAVGETKVFKERLSECVCACLTHEEIKGCICCVCCC